MLVLMVLLLLLGEGRCGMGLAGGGGGVGFSGTRWAIEGLAGRSAGSGCGVLL